MVKNSRVSCLDIYQTTKVNDRKKSSKKPICFTGHVDTCEDSHTSQNPHGKKRGTFCDTKKTRLFCVVKFRVFETTRRKENPSRIEKWNPGKKGIKISISWWIFLTTRGAGIHKEIRRMIFQNPRFQKTK